MTLGSSILSLIFFKNVTASLPSISLWSYVSARYIIGHATIYSPIHTGLLTVLCIPRIADWGGLMIGVPSIEPKIPPLVTVKVPPVMSSKVIEPSLARLARLLISCSISAKLISPAFLITGTTRPVGEATATDTSMKSL